MKRQRLRKGSGRKRVQRLRKGDMSIADLLEKKVYRFLHEAGHDIGKFDDRLHKYLHETEERLERAGHTVERTWEVLNSRNNYANFSIMPGHNPGHRKESMENVEKIVHQLYPDAKIEWGLEPGVAYPVYNKSFMQDFRVSNVSLSDIIVINNTLMQYGGGFK
jgi:hypothetical protein